MNRYKGSKFHHGRNQKFTKDTIIHAIRDYNHRKELGMIAIQVANKYHMSTSLLYKKLAYFNKLNQMEI